MAELALSGQNALTQFQGELMRDEKLLWAGQPQPRLFSAGDLFLVPFGLFFFGFSIFWILAASGILTEPHKLQPFGLFGIPFVLVGFYLLIGRFFVKAWRRRNTYYAVTNQRVLVLCTVPNRSVQAVYINGLPVLNKTLRSDGTGTISFGFTNPQAAMYADSGMDFFGTASGLPMAPAFFDVKDASTVCELIDKQRSK